MDQKPALKWSKHVKKIKQKFSHFLEHELLQPQSFQSLNENFFLGIKISPTNDNEKTFIIVNQTCFISFSAIQSRLCSAFRSTYPHKKSHLVDGSKNTNITANWFSRLGGKKREKISQNCLSISHRPWFNLFPLKSHAHSRDRSSVWTRLFGVKSIRRTLSDELMASGRKIAFICPNLMLSDTFTEIYGDRFSKNPSD